MLLELKNLNASYEDLRVLWDITLEVREKEITSVIGPNGAGKTTLLKTISGLIRPISGEISFFGQETSKLQSYEIVEKGIIQVPEGRQLFPQMSVIENLELGAYTKNARRKRDENLEKIFDLFPILKERKDQLSSTLSGGEQQMLAIARGLMAMPVLLMLDEPSLGLAPKLVLSLFDTIREINKTGVTILLVEQNIVRALKLASQAYVLENGRISMKGNGQDLLDDPYVKKAYIGM